MSLEVQDWKTARFCKAWQMLPFTVVFSLLQEGAEINPELFEMILTLAIFHNELYGLGLHDFGL